MGEEAHIVAKSVAGPRGSSPLDVEDRDQLGNLILLCPTHHTVIDSAPEEYSTELLQHFRAEHEARVRLLGDFTGPDSATMQYANILQGWADRTVDAAWWGHLTRGVFSARAQIPSVCLTEAVDASTWLLGRRWPGSLVQVEKDMASFREVLDDLLAVASRTMYRHPYDDSVLWHEPFYKKGRTREETDELFAQYDWIGNLMCDLALELARSANAIITSVSADYDPLWRLEDGLVLITVVDVVVGQTSLRPLYVESTERYEGLDSFLTARSSRADSIGRGRNASAERQIGLN